MKIPRRTADLFAFLFDTRVPLLFLFGALVIAVLGNAAYDFITDLTGKYRSSLVLIIGGGLVLIGVVVLSLKAVAEIILKRSAARVGGSEAFSADRKAIIFTVGKQSDTVDLCIRNQKPEFIGLVCTAGSEAYADNLIGSHEFDSNTCQKKIVNPWDINEVRDSAAQLLTWIQTKVASPHEIVFDVTGGLTPMSVGAFVVAEENRIDSQYVRSDYDDSGKRLPNTEEAVFIRRYSGDDGLSEKLDDVVGGR